MRHQSDDITAFLRPVVDVWLRESGALSALPDAPVVPDEPRRRWRLRPRRRYGAASPRRPQPPCVRDAVSARPPSPTGIVDSTPSSRIRRSPSIASRRPAR